MATARQVDRPYVTLDTQPGLGEVSLLDDLTLNELPPRDCLIGYLHGEPHAGVCPAAAVRPTQAALERRAHRGRRDVLHFQIASSETEKAPTLPLDWDLFGPLTVSLTLPL